jgi:predicted N-formylglutamate amidohydrolase
MTTEPEAPHHRPILAPDEPPAVEVVNPNGASTAFLICDHASFRVPASLSDLGLSEAARRAHIGWDIGAADVARRLSYLLDAPLVLSGYSRLVIDCNRPPGSLTSIPAVTCGVAVPGNAAVDEREARAREEACFWPYHRAIERLLGEREARGARTVLLSIHSFTPSLYGLDRPWNISLLYGKDKRLAAHFLEELGGMTDIMSGDNEPYQVTDRGDYGIPVYSERRGNLGVLVEIRQDCIATAPEAHAWADRLATLYKRIEPRLGL